LKDSTVSAQLSDTKAAEEVKALKDFFDMMHEEPERTVYGWFTKRIIVLMYVRI